MNRRKQIITLLFVFVVLAALIYLQVREWRKFDWAALRMYATDLNWWLILQGVILVHLADFMRAVRWKIFLRPTRPDVNWKSLIAPQYVGFAGLALLGRPGELVRPYLIAMRTNESFPSQMALWFIERAFDTAAVALIVAIDLFAIPVVRVEYAELRIFGYLLLAMSVGFVGLLYVLWRNGPAVSAWMCKRIEPFSHTFAHTLEHRLRTASEALHAIRDPKSLFEASVISMFIWFLVALAYRQTMHAFPAVTGLPDYGLPQAVLLMGASVAGGVMQLPVVGGGSQLATVALLSNSFNYNERPEIAVAAGIVLWLVTFISVTPLGLLLAHFEHVSIRNLSKESGAAERDPSDDK
jgi:glycosyltransferase 2 family protein